jgi:hypothetical protein
VSARRSTSPGSDQYTSSLRPDGAGGRRLRAGGWRRSAAWAGLGGAGVGAEVGHRPDGDPSIRAAVHRLIGTAQGADVGSVTRTRPLHHLSVLDREADGERGQPPEGADEQDDAKSEQKSL